jgi:hypothetical protein
MREVYKKLATSFTTADTEGPVSINFDGKELVVTFTNFRTPIQKVVFYDARAFSWTGWEDVSPEAEYDGVCEVTGSMFLEPWERFSVQGFPFVHFKLGFNACGMFLDVVATRMVYQNG